MSMVAEASISSFFRMTGKVEYGGQEHINYGSTGRAFYGHSLHQYKQ
jgi:hypothetical protein